MKYDIIGDIHGHAEELKSLLGKLGYRKNKDGCYIPPNVDRQALFVGDFIDRGPGQFEVIDIVRDMVEAGHAKAIMGNHEFNAGMYHTHVLRGGTLRPLREHSVKNKLQHRAFLDAYDAQPALGRRNIQWLKNLPLWLEEDGLRLVHAMWNRDAMETLRSAGCVDAQNRIRPEAWGKLEDLSKPEGQAAELLTKGLEMPLPEGVVFKDSDGHVRDRVRVKWWGNQSNPQTLDRISLGTEPGAMPALEADTATKGMITAAHEHPAPVFFGHYWQEGPVPAIEHERAICLDQSVAKNGHLAAATITMDRHEIQSIAFTSVPSVPKNVAGSGAMRA